MTISFESVNESNIIFQNIHFIKLLEDKYLNYFENFNKHDTLNIDVEYTFYKIFAYYLYSNKIFMNIKKSNLTYPQMQRFTLQS